MNEEIAIGSKVTWIKASPPGSRTISIRLYHGTVVEIQGDQAVVVGWAENQKGRKSLPLADLSPDKNDPYAIFDLAAKAALLTR